SVEAAIYCDATVAIATHRMMAALLDMSISLVAVGVFLATFQFAGKEIVFTTQTIPAYVVTAVAITLLYRLLFCIGNGDTPGMRWTGLRLVNFDGHQPTRQQR